MRACGRWIFQKKKNFFFLKTIDRLLESKGGGARTKPLAHLFVHLETNVHKVVQ